jgi:hypothetical protein
MTARKKTTLCHSGKKACDRLCRKERRKGQVGLIPPKDAIRAGERKLSPIFEPFLKRKAALKRLEERLPPRVYTVLEPLIGSFNENSVSIQGLKAKKFFAGKDMKTATFVLTARTSDEKRIDAIVKALELDVDREGMVFIVSAMRDSDFVLDLISRIDVSKRHKLHPVKIPDGPKSAGYTRSWCFYLASLIPSKATVIVRDDRRLIWTAKRSNRVIQMNHKNPWDEQWPKFIKALWKSHDPNKPSQDHIPRGMWVTFTPQRGTRNLGKTIWPLLNQAYMANAQTFRDLQKIGGYPQAPVFEDYLAATLMHKVCGFVCMTAGRFYCKRTIAGCESLARPGDSTGDFKSLENVYDPIQLEMALRATCALHRMHSMVLSQDRLTFTVADTTQTFVKGNRKGGGTVHFLLAQWVLTREAITDAMETALGELSRMSVCA